MINHYFMTRNKHKFTILICAVFFCYYSFHNKYPILTIHTGDYMESGINALQSFNKSFYGTFIIHTSWLWSLWLVVFAQALFLSASLYSTFISIPSQTNSGNRLPVFIAFCLFSTFFTVGSYSVSSISKEVFTAILVILSINVIIKEHLTKKSYIMYLLLSVICIFIDLHNFSFFALANCFLIARLLKRTSLSYFRVPIVATLFILLYCLFNYLISLRLLQLSPLTFSQLIRKTYLLFCIEETQFDHVGHHTKTFNMLGAWYNWEVREFMLSRQYQSWFNLYYLGRSQSIVNILCLLIYSILLFPRFKILSYEKVTISFVLLAIFLNLILTPANYTNSFVVIGISWLIPIPLFFILFRKCSLYTN